MSSAVAAEHPATGKEEPEVDENEIEDGEEEHNGAANGALCQILVLKRSPFTLHFALDQETQRRRRKRRNLKRKNQNRAILLVLGSQSFTQTVFIPRVNSSRIRMSACSQCFTWDDLILV